MLQKRRMSEKDESFLSSRLLVGAALPILAAAITFYFARIVAILITFVLRFKHLYKPLPHSDAKHCYSLSVLLYCLLWQGHGRPMHSVQ